MEDNNPFPKFTPSKICVACRNKVSLDKNYIRDRMEAYGAVYHSKFLQIFFFKIPSDLQREHEQDFELCHSKLHELDKKFAPIRNELETVWQNFIEKKGGKLPDGFGFELCKNCSEELKPQEKPLEKKLEEIFKTDFEELIDGELGAKLRKVSKKIESKFGEEQSGRVNRETMKETYDELEKIIKADVRRFREGRSQASNSSKREREREMIHPKPIICLGY